MAKKGDDVTGTSGGKTYSGSATGSTQSGLTGNPFDKDDGITPIRDRDGVERNVRVTDNRGQRRR